MFIHIFAYKSNSEILGIISDLDLNETESRLLKA